MSPDKQKLRRQSDAIIGTVLFSRSVPLAIRVERPLSDGEAALACLTGTPGVGKVHERTTGRLYDGKAGKVSSCSRQWRLMGTTVDERNGHRHAARSPCAWARGPRPRPTLRHEGGISTRASTSAARTPTTPSTKAWSYSSPSPAVRQDRRPVLVFTHYFQPRQRVVSAGVGVKPPTGSAVATAVRGSPPASQREPRELDRRCLTLRQIGERFTPHGPNLKP